MRFSVVSKRFLTLLLLQLFLVPLLFLASGKLNAALAVTVSGLVRNQATGNALPGAWVNCNSGNCGGYTTDGLGGFRFTVGAGTYTITAGKGGFYSKSVTISVKTSNVSAGTISLVPFSNAPAKLPTPKPAIKVTSPPPAPLVTLNVYTQDANTNARFPDAGVSLDNGVQYVTTKLDRYGNFIPAAFRVKANSTHSIKITKSGYTTFSTTGITVASGTRNFVASMKKSASPGIDLKPSQAQSGGGSSEIRGKIFDANKVGIPGATVEIVGIAFGSAVTPPRATTGADGSFALTGLRNSTDYQLRISALGYETKNTTATAGTTVTINLTKTSTLRPVIKFGVTQSPSIHGSIYVDTNQNRFIDNDDTYFADGARVNLSGSLADTDTTYGPTGLYQFVSNLVEGSYTLELVVPGGYSPIITKHNLTLTQTNPYAERNFLIAPPPKATTITACSPCGDINGRMWRDFNVDGVQNSSEEPLANTRVYAFADKLYETFTDSQGNYTFANLPANTTYTITTGTSAYVPTSEIAIKKTVSSAQTTTANIGVKEVSRTSPAPTTSSSSDSSQSQPSSRPQSPPTSTIIPSPTPVPGDINKDNRADTNDYAIWECEFLGGGLCRRTGTNKTADLNRDSIIDLRDFAIWRNVTKL